MRAIKNSITTNAVVAYEADTSKDIDGLEKRLQGALPYTVLTYGNATFWRPSWREVWQLLTGARVVVIVQGSEQPWMEVQVKWPSSYGDSQKSELV